MLQPTLFETPVLLPPTTPGGFTYRENFLTESEHAELLTIFQTLPFHQAVWDGYEANRRVIGYGWESRPDIPDFLKPYLARAEHWLHLKPGTLDSALIQEYTPGCAIGWHRDKRSDGSTPGHVAGISLASSCQFRLRRPHKTKPARDWERFTVTAEPRSLYCMAGDSRREWQHSIPAVEQLRYSITFRDF